MTDPTEIRIQLQTQWIGCLVYLALMGGEIADLIATAPDPNLLGTIRTLRTFQVTPQWQGLALPVVAAHDQVLAALIAEANSRGLNLSVTEPRRIG